MTKYYYNVYLKVNRSITKLLIKPTTPEQAKINARNGTGIANSLHCKSLAFDINLFDSNGDYLEDAQSHKQFGEFWESLNPANRWGGNFKDKNGKPFPDGNHYERNEK